MLVAIVTALQSYNFSEKIKGKLNKMSSNFSANQFERAYSPQKLQNYEVPAKFKEHPSMRRGKTKVISDNRGHLKSSVPRSPNSPWGTFVGTWQQERRPLNIKTQSPFLRSLEKSGQSSKQSTRVSSARSGSACSVNSPTAVSPLPDNAQMLTEQTRSPSNASSRPATVASVRSSVEGSRNGSPENLVRSPTPSGYSRASSAMGSVTIASPPSTAGSQTKPGSPRPLSPPQSTSQSRLHTSPNCDIAQN